MANGNGFTENHKEFIAKPEVNFWLPIIIYAITLTAAYFGLSNKIDLINNNINHLSQVAIENKDKITRITQSLNNFSNRITELEIKIK